MSEGARAVAVRFLRDLFRREQNLDVLNEDRDVLALDPRDRRLVTELVYGVLRNRELLDYYIACLSNRPLAKTDEVVVWILRTGLYQIDFLRVPDRAAVHEAVDLCRRFGKTSAAGFVNALLRQFLRRKPLLPEGQSTEALAIRYSHPPWLVQRYRNRWGDEPAEIVLRRNNELPVPFVWVNTFKIDVLTFCKLLQEDKIEYEFRPELPNCLIVRAPGFSQHDLYQRGYCFFMDLASREVAHLPKLQGKQVLGDFCAAPGNKSFLLTARKDSSARLFACEPHLKRLQHMVQRAVFYQVTGVHFVRANLENPSPFKAIFDFVLLDVPCSGLGTLKSNPDIRWKIQEAHLERLHARQIRLLRNGFATLRPGGQLLYSTCSTEPEENEQVIEEFLKTEPSALQEGDSFRTFPQPHPGDCFFASFIRHA